MLLKSLNIPLIAPTPIPHLGRQLPNFVCTDLTHNNQSHFSQIFKIIWWYLMIKPLLMTDPKSFVKCAEHTVLPKETQINRKIHHCSLLPGVSAYVINGIAIYKSNFNVSDLTGCGKEILTECTKITRCI